MTNDNLTVEQRYANIIASSTMPEDTKDALAEFLSRNTYFQKQKYYEFLAKIESDNVPKGFDIYYRDHIEKYRPVIEAEEFIAERRQEAIKGDFETELELRVYVINKLKEKGFSQEHEYYDSPEYEKDYDKIRAVFKSAEVPAPLAGIIPYKDLKKALKVGDTLYQKKDTYSFSNGQATGGYRIVKGGEVLKVKIKYVKVRSTGDYMGKPFDHEISIPLNSISHVIRDGKRYKVDHSTELI
jgi:hypothetical protein